MSQTGRGFATVVVVVGGGIAVLYAAISVWFECSFTEIDSLSGWMNHVCDRGAREGLVPISIAGLGVAGLVVVVWMIHSTPLDTDHRADTRKWQIAVVSSLAVAAIVLLVVIPYAGGPVWKGDVEVGDRPELRGVRLVAVDDEGTPVFVAGEEWNLEEHSGRRTLIVWWDDEHCDRCPEALQQAHEASRSGDIDVVAFAAGFSYAPYRGLREYVDEHEVGLPVIAEWGYLNARWFSYGCGFWCLPVIYLVDEHGEVVAKSQDHRVEDVMSANGW